MSNIPPVRLGLAGLGVVGSGLVRILDENMDIIRRRLGREIVLCKVLDKDPEKKKFLPEHFSTVLVDDMDLLVNDPEIDIIVELMGGTDFSRQLIRAALEAGKHVVTANKALLAEHGTELFALAAEKNRGLYFEAAVAGAIPIVGPMKRSLCANHILHLASILNGTANYILTRMTEEGLAFDAALAEAQQLGYAEANPALDIDGLDSAHKLILLIRMAYGLDYPLPELPVEGISKVGTEDILFAGQMGFKIKLIGLVREINGQIEAGIHPTLVGQENILSRVDGVLNGIMVTGDACQEIFFEGRGAGSLPTASSVVADVISLVRTSVDNTGFAEQILPKADILPGDQAESRFYVRFNALDQPGVLAETSKIMANNGISIAQALQKRVSSFSEAVPIIFLTHTAKRKSIEAALQAIEALPFITDPVVHYRVL